jgi:leucyl aminopeptidase
MTKSGTTPASPIVTVYRAIPAVDKVRADHVLVLVSDASPVQGIFGNKERTAALRRRPDNPESPGKSAGPVTTAVGGKLVTWVTWDAKASTFSQLNHLRKALESLIADSPQRLAIIVQIPGADSPPATDAAIYTSAVNGCYGLGKVSGKPGAAPLRHVDVFGVEDPYSAKRVLASAGGNLLARQFTLRPPNDLTPQKYRADIKALAKREGWQFKEFGFKSLQKMGAGAFCAVAQGSPRRDAAVVHLSYQPKKSAKPRHSVALVGKGICMDTGGHGLKSAKGMYGMHEDMNGSAVVLGILKAASDLKLPVAIDAWLAISENHISPDAYQPGDIVTALDGSTIEVVHTDAEGRMVLADTITLANRSKPDAMFDFATLTGAMIHSLGNRMSGIFCNQPELQTRALDCGAQSGERVVAFPLDDDYDAALDSKVADIKQCLISGEADAIYAARFLARFVGRTPWVHMDLSACRCEGGLGAVSADVNGFGVAWGLAMLETYGKV